MKEEEEKIIGNVIQPRILEEEMQQSYLDYAMSVIVARALPDVRDGLKPVQRRILYAMQELGLRHNAKFVKSARIVGDTHGKYHPHGDLAIYDSLARMAQDFSMRYTLIHGQGNFGSMDGDEPAAQRYTEAKMAAITEEMLADIDKDTIDFLPNYDGTQKEPKVMPSKIPQLLMNGSVGIAVGMATNIPPHNLNELMAGLIQLISKPESDVNDLMQHIKGPDFPTGGIIFNPSEIKNAYSTGRGRIVMRAVAEIVERGKGLYQIIISELPYQVNKATLLEKIADLVRDKRIVGISDIRDESAREGVRIVIELRKDAYPKKILNQLFKLTALQTTFHINMLALADGLQPQIFTLKEALTSFIEFRKEVVRRRTAFELKKAAERAHILEGLKIALDHLDAVITTIKKSADRDEAKNNLIKKFQLTELQANAILDMRLSALAALERQKVEEEFKEKKKLIEELKATLKDSRKIAAIIKNEFQDIQKRFADNRRTKISRETVGEFSEKDLIPNEEVVITITQGGYVKRQPLQAFRSQQRGGKGVIGVQPKEEDVVIKIQAAHNHDDLLFFTNMGRVFHQKVYEIPLASRIAKGTPVVNLIQLSPDEKVTSWQALNTYSPDDFLVMFTAKGFIKKTKVQAYENIRSNGLIAVKLDKDDSLLWVQYATPKDEIIITTREGKAIRFKQDEARPMGRTARGVRGIKLHPGDEVVGADVIDPATKATVLVISSKGLGKRTPIASYSLQHRGGLGVKTVKITDKTGKLQGAKIIDDPNSDLIITSTKGQVIRMPLSSIPTLSRATQGVRVIRLGEGDQVASFTVISKSAEEGELTTAMPLRILQGPAQGGEKKKVVKALAKKKPARPAKVVKKVTHKIKISHYKKAGASKLVRPRQTSKIESRSVKKAAARAGFKIKTIKVKKAARSIRKPARLRKIGGAKPIFKVRKLKR